MSNRKHLDPSIETSFSVLRTIVCEYAKKLVGNWQKFESFGWHDSPIDDINWCIIYVSNRDSGLLDESNAAAMEKEFESFLNGEGALEEDSPDIINQHHGHWACGHVDGYAIRVYNQDGTITPAFRKYVELKVQLDDYPVLDEDDYHQREYDAAIEAIRQQGQKYLSDSLDESESKECPKDGATRSRWEGKVFSYLWEHNQSELENNDDQGAYPSEESVKEAMIELDLTDDDSDSKE